MAEVKLRVKGMSGIDEDEYSRIECNEAFYDMKFVMNNNIDLFNEVNSYFNKWNKKILADTKLEELPPLLKTELLLIKVFCDYLSFNYSENKNKSAEGLSEAKDDFDDIIKLLKIVQNKLNKHSIDILLDLNDMTSDACLIEELSKSYTQKELNVPGEYIAKLSTDVHYVPYAILSWAKWKRKHLEEKGKHIINKKYFEARNILINGLLKFLFTVQGIKPTIPNKSTINNINPLKPPENNKKLNRYFFIKEGLDIINKTQSHSSNADKINDILKKSEWNSEQEKIVLGFKVI